MEKKRRKKKTYLDYDYEEAYREEIEKIAEEQMLDLLKRGRGTVYATKEIRAGDQLEIEVYPCFTKEQKNLIPDEAKKKKQRQAQRNLNEKNSRKMCERVINANFTDRDIWATFTYTDENMPESMQQAKKDMQNYIKRLNYRRQKMGLKNARYVYVTECSKRGRWHHHIVLDGDMPMDIVENLWTAGKRNEVRRLQRDEDGLTGMARYITKSPNDKGGRDEGKGQKSWTPSKGLKRPEEKVTHYKFKTKDVNEVVRDANALPEILDKWFADQGYTFRSGSIKYNDFNGRFYIYGRMSRKGADDENKGIDRISGGVRQRKRSRDPGNKSKAKDQIQTARDNPDHRPGAAGDRPGTGGSGSVR